jgi:hypothetical protein
VSAPYNIREVFEMADTQQAVPRALPRINIHAILALSGMAGPVILAVTDFTAAFTNPDYSLVKNSISSLALTQLGWLQTIGFLAIGLLVEIFVAGLLFNIRNARGFHLGIGALVFFGFGLLLVGSFHTDPSGSTRTIEGTIHWSAALAVFWLFPAAVLLMATAIKRDPAWRNLYIYTVVTGVLAVMLVVALMFLKDAIGWFGLYERILVINMIIWVEVAAVKLLRHSTGTVIAG